MKTNKGSMIKFLPTKQMQHDMSPQSSQELVPVTWLYFKSYGNFNTTYIQLFHIKQYLKRQETEYEAPFLSAGNCM